MCTHALYTQRCHLAIVRAARRGDVHLRRQVGHLSDQRVVHGLSIIDDEQHNVSSQLLLHLVAQITVPVGVDVDHIHTAHTVIHTVL